MPDLREADVLRELDDLCRQSRSLLLAEGTYLDAVFLIEAIQPDVIRLTAIRGRESASVHLAAHVFIGATVEVLEGLFSHLLARLRPPMPLREHDRVPFAEADLAEFLLQSFGDSQTVAFADTRTEWCWGDADPGGELEFECGRPATTAVGLCDTCFQRVRDTARK